MPERLSIVRNLVVVKENPSLNRFKKAQSFVGAQAVLAAADPPSFEQMEAQMPKLVKQINAFDLFETLAMIAGLLSLASLHANTVRLELLQNLVHRNAHGINKPTRHRVTSWLNQYLGNDWAGSMEDPVEDVFISNVVSNLGNSRIFEGRLGSE
jgi:hypothetical protein